MNKLITKYWFFLNITAAIMLSHWSQITIAHVIQCCLFATLHFLIVSIWIIRDKPISRILFIFMFLVILIPLKKISYSSELTLIYGVNAIFIITAYQTFLHKIFSYFCKRKLKLKE